MPANVQAMAYHGKEPWHGLGTPVPRDATAKQMILAAGLDWEVSLRPARGARKINKRGEFSRYEVVRLPRERDEGTEVLLGVVSRRYKPLQNAEAFAFFDPIVTEQKAFFETAGALGEGERIWVMAKMPGAMTIVPGDDCMKYLLLGNSHSGDGSVTVKFTSVRVVCQNTLMMAMRDGQKAYRVRHSGQMHLKLDELRDFLSIAQAVYLHAEKSFRRLARIQVTGNRLGEYLASVFPRTGRQTKQAPEPPRWGLIREVFDSQPDLQLQGVKGTLWAAYNAVTRFEDYKQPKQEEQPEQRLERTWFGSGADIKLKALEKATEMADGWSNQRP